MRRRRRHALKISTKERLKRRIRAYENFDALFGCILETSFKHIFNRTAQEKGIRIKNPEKSLYNSYRVAEWIKSIIEACSEKECQELNWSLDCYQIDKEKD